MTAQRLGEPPDPPPVEDVFDVTPIPGGVRMRIAAKHIEIDLTVDAAYGLAFLLADASGRATRGETT